MELRQLETLARVAATGSLTRASEELSITQPAVTRQIAALEAELRTRLFDRLGRRVELTAAGLELHRYAVEITRLAAEAETAVRDISAGGRGRLALGASSTAATYLLAPLLREYGERYPHVTISVRTGPSPRVAEMVASNAVDLGVVMDYRGDGLATRVLGEYVSVVVTYPEHPLARNPQRFGVPVVRLADEPLVVMQEGAGLRRYIDELLGKSGRAPNVAIAVDNVEAIKKMVEARLGVSVLPSLAVRGEVAAGRLVALDLEDHPDARRQVALIHRKDKYLTRALKAFMAMARATVGEALGDTARMETGLRPRSPRDLRQRELLAIECTRDDEASSR